MMELDYAAVGEQLMELSQKQNRVLQQLKLGKSVKEISFDLSMSEPTVRTHIERLKDKLNCQDLLELRMWPSSQHANGLPKANLAMGVSRM
jgi:DNA-binding NarL/FixJ family response regulator